MPRLVTALRPIEATSQLIQGDLTGNVLFADGLPPAIIDFSPYWRPAGFAAAIVVGDALLWEGADEELPRNYDHVPFFSQYLVRALIYRAVTDRLARTDEPLRPDDADPFGMPSTPRADSRRRVGPAPSRSPNFGQESAPPCR